MPDHHEHSPKDDELRRIFREEGSGDAGWDQPRDRVWQGIQSGWAKTRRRRMAWWPWVTGILLLGGAWWWWPLPHLEPAPMSSSLSMLQAPIPLHVPAHDPPVDMTTKTSDPLRVEQDDVASKPSSHPEKSPDRSPAPANKHPEPRQQEHPDAPYTPAASTHKDSMHRTGILEGPSGKSFTAHSDPFGSETDPRIIASDRPWKGLPLRIAGVDLPAETHGPLTVLTIPATTGKASRTLRQEIGLYAHGREIQTQLRARQSAFQDHAIALIEQESYRLGLSYGLVLSNGWVFGTGLEYQRISEVSSREHELLFTRQGGVPDAQGLAQTLNLAMYGAMGQTRASLPVHILERMAPLDYQEGETIRLKVGWKQQLDLLRIPLRTGWRWQRAGWFLEGNAGLALTMPVNYRGEVRQVQEFRNRVRIRESLSTESPRGLRNFFAEWQTGIHAGWDLRQGWSLQAGYDYWRSMSSIIDHPEYRSSLQGHGLTIGIHKWWGGSLGR